MKKNAWKALLGGALAASMMFAGAASASANEGNSTPAADQTAAQAQAAPAADATATESLKAKGDTPAKVINDLGNWKNLSRDTRGDVRGNISLPTESTGGVAIAWQSSDPKVVSTDGIVTRPAVGADVARHDEYVARLSSYLDLLAPIGAHLVMCVEPAVRELPQLPSVCYDQTNVVHQAVRALASRGHRRMAFLGAGDFSTAKQRMDGFAAGMADLGAPMGDDMMIPCDNTAEAAHAKALRLLGRADRPTAVVAFSDFVALGVYRAARELGLAIPDDVSVIGFDDLACDVDMTPPLSSIHAPWQAMGEQAARFAMDGVPSGAAPHVTFASQLVLRGSVGECAGR